VYNAGEGNVDEGRVFKLFNEGSYTAAIAAFHDHRFSWEYVKDELGARFPDPANPGEYLKKLVEKNGLIVRRGTEMGLAMTKME
jgi:GH24 family phage-related lysozyme (muramidase)